MHTRLNSFYTCAGTINCWTCPLDVISIAKYPSHFHFCPLLSMFINFFSLQLSSHSFLYHIIPKIPLILFLLAYHLTITYHILLQKATSFSALCIGLYKYNLQRKGLEFCNLQFWLVLALLPPILCSYFLWHTARGVEITHNLGSCLTSNNFDQYPPLPVLLLL